MIEKYMAGQKGYIDWSPVDATADEDNWRLTKMPVNLSGNLARFIVYLPKFELTPFIRKMATGDQLYLFECYWCNINAFSAMPNDVMGYCYQ